MAAAIWRYESTDEELEHIKPYIPEEQTIGSRVTWISENRLRVGEVPSKQNQLYLDPEVDPPMPYEGTS